MLLGDLFERNVTRTIPPVVYFHEQEPIELQREVEEYIITGGYPKGDDRATPDGIHEQFVRLLTNLAADLDKTSNASKRVELPSCWISGYYGSGKSSFAKLLGLSLDGLTLPHGRTLAESLLAQDRSPNAKELRAAWERLTSLCEPLSVVFDVGSKARDDEHVHAVAVRQVQQRLGYSKTSNLVAEYELKLELEGMHDAFMSKVTEVQKKPWSALKDSQLVEDEFSRIMHELRPDLFPDVMTWVDSRAGSAFESRRSADEAAIAIQQMMERRYPRRTLFLVIDEVSQYVHDNTERMLALQSFVSALGQRMNGKAWILATGQHRLEESSGAGGEIARLKDRFRPALRVHLGTGNIRDVVHKRLLRKKTTVEADLVQLFDQHLADLKLYAYKCEDVTPTELVEIYPLLPKQIDLLMDITTGLRSRSVRSQGDAYAIRGLLQLLGDLFRERGLAQREIGQLIPIDMVYEVLHSALGPDVALTLGRAHDHCTKVKDPLMARVVKAVAMLELVQDDKEKKTTADLIARCLYERLGQGSLERQVQAALDELVGHGFVALSEKTGYKIESAAGQEWQRERDAYVPATEHISEQVRDTLRTLLDGTDAIKLDQLPLPWVAYFSDGLSAKDVRFKDGGKHTVLTADFQFTRGDGSDHWVPRSGTQGYENKFVWVAGETQDVRAIALRLLQSSRVIDRYGRASEGSISEDTRRLLIDERNRNDRMRAELAVAVQSAWLSGALYFRGRKKIPGDFGQTFKTALSTYGAIVARELYPNPMTFSIKESDIAFLINDRELAAPPAVLGEGKLGILALDGGRHEASCTGRLPSDLFAFVKDNGSIEGSTLIEHFGSPPHGVAPDLIRACVVGLLRGGKVRIEIPGVGVLTSVKDEGARELLKDSGLKRAQITVNLTDLLNQRDRVAICAMFKETLGADVARDNDAIADAVMSRFAGVRDRLNEIEARFRRLPSAIAHPKALDELARALESCRRSRQVEAMLQAVKTSLTNLRQGIIQLRRMETDLTDEAIETLRDAAAVAQHQGPALQALEPTSDVASEVASKVSRAIAILDARLTSDRPWEDPETLAANIAVVRTEYQARRRAVLDAHAHKLEIGVDDLKRRDGFDKLDADERHKVLRHLREGGAATTDEKAIAPALESLPALLRARLDSSTEKALLELGATLEAKGGTPTVDVTLDFRGREIKSEPELDRFLEELRRKILHELSANHHVRLK